MYPVKDANEREQIEWVFGLTGGELADKPLRYATIEKGVYQTPTIERHWARYFYDGVPDYAEREFARRGGQFITIVTCELYGAMPRAIYTAGKLWRRVASFTSSGETECPGGAVERDENDPVDVGTCVLCSAPGDASHGMIYIGNGWAEVVYRARD